MRIRRKRREPDGAIAAARAHTQEALVTAEHQRDREVSKLRDERTAVVEPLRREKNINHLSELAMRALRGE